MGRRGARHCVLFHRRRACPNPVDLLRCRRHRARPVPPGSRGMVEEIRRRRAHRLDAEFLDRALGALPADSGRPWHRYRSVPSRRRLARNPCQPFSRPVEASRKGRGLLSRAHQEQHDRRTPGGAALVDRRRRLVLPHRPVEEIRCEAADDVARIDRDGAPHRQGGARARQPRPLGLRLARQGL